MTYSKEDIPLDLVGPKSSRERKLEGKERERKEREEEGGEISSTSSLDLAAIGPSAFVRVKGKVCPRDEDFA